MNKAADVYSLPELLDGVGQIRNADAGQVTNLAEGFTSRRVEALVPTLQGTAIVGRHAGLRIPVVAARAPRQLWGSTRLKCLTG